MSESEGLGMHILTVFRNGAVKSKYSMLCIYHRL